MGEAATETESATIAESATITHHRLTPMRGDAFSVVAATWESHGRRLNLTMPIEGLSEPQWRARLARMVQLVESDAA